MAKRELISREEVLLHPFANGKYDYKNADINFILGHESYKEWLETLPVFTEQEIVKPYLEKLKTEVEKKHTKAKQRGWVLQMNAYTDCLQIIDNLLSESEET